MNTTVSTKRPAMSAILIGTKQKATNRQLAKMLLQAQAEERDYWNKTSAWNWVNIAAYSTITLVSAVIWYGIFSLL